MNLTVQPLQMAAPTANEVVTVLNDLGGKYSYLTTWEHGEFEVPYDEAHRSVFKIVSGPSFYRTNKKPRREVLIVKHP